MVLAGLDLLSDEFIGEAKRQYEVGYAGVQPGGAVMTTGNSPEICERCVRELVEWLKPLPMPAREG